MAFINTVAQHVFDGCAKDGGLWEYSVVFDNEKRRL